MSLKIRMSRGGAKKRPFYRIVVADSRFPRDGRFIERLGTYDPMLAKDNPDRVVLKTERIRHWLDHGATPSDRVARFLGHADIIPMPARRNNPKKGLAKAKAQARMKEAEKASKAAAEAAAAPPAAAPVEAPPAEQAAAEAPAEAPAAEAPAEAAPADQPAAEGGEEDKPAAEGGEEDKKEE